MGYHPHPDHEEIFHVLEGEVTFETPDGDVPVAAGEVFFVPSDHPQRGRATGDHPARVITVGAPKATDGSITQEDCPACGETTRRDYDVVERDGREAYELRCAGCGAVTDVLTAGPS